MIKKRFGNTGIEVTQLGYGAMELRGPKVWGGREITEDQAETILNAVLDAGINFVDTAPDYGYSEDRIGKFISSRRDEYYLATKCGCDPIDQGDKWATPHTWTRDRLMRNIDESLQRMKTDHVDFLQIHNARGDDVDWDMLIQTLQDIKSQGLTKHIGVSHTNPWLDDLVARGVFECFQIPYSCMEPEHHDAITKAGQSGAGVIIRGGISKGGPGSETVPEKRVDMWKEAGLDELCDEMSSSELILRYTLTHPHCHTTIVGTMNPEHLAQNIEAANKGPLPDDIYKEVTRRVKDVLAKQD